MPKPKTSKRTPHRRSGPRLLDMPGLWANRHLQSAVATLGRLMHTPLPTGMTIAVIGISLALPAALFVVTENLRTMAGGWDQAAAISLFLKQDVDDAGAARLAEQLRARPELAQVHLISREQALNEFGHSADSRTPSRSSRATPCRRSWRFIRRRSHPRPSGCRRFTTS